MRAFSYPKLKVSSSASSRWSRTASAVSGHVDANDAKRRRDLAPLWRILDPSGACGSPGAVPTCNTVRDVRQYQDPQCGPWRGGPQADAGPAILSVNMRTGNPWAGPPYRSLLKGSEIPGSTRSPAAFGGLRVQPIHEGCRKPTTLTDPGIPEGGLARTSDPPASYSWWFGSACKKKEGPLKKVWVGDVVTSRVGAAR